MPIMPSTGPTPPTYPSDRADLWRAIEGLERRLAEPAPGLQVKPGVVTSLRPSVRVLGQSAPRDVWRVNDGAALAVGDEVLCSETALGLVVLSRVVVPPRGLDVPPAGNLIPNPYALPVYEPGGGSTSLLRPDGNGPYWLNEPNGGSPYQTASGWHLSSGTASSTYIGYYSARSYGYDFPYCCIYVDTTTATTVRLYPVPFATDLSSPPWPEVAPDASYTFRIATYGEASDPGSLIVGIEWWGDSGLISTSSATVATTHCSSAGYLPPAEEQWHVINASGVDSPLVPYSGFVCYPTIAATAPAGVRWARPFIDFGSFMWIEFYATDASLVA